jgi:bifunctional non-homologous end joining protein LigD
MKKALRVGKILVDWSQNDDHKTTVNVYSLRAKQRPTVSTPVSWDEVKRCLSKKDPNLLVFESQQVLERVEKMGDLFAPVLTEKQKLPEPGKLRIAAEPRGTRSQSKKVVAPAASRLAKATKAVSKAAVRKK